MRDWKDQLSVSKANKTSWLRIGRLLSALLYALGLMLSMGISANSQAQINPEQIRTIVRISTNVGDFSIGLYNDSTWRTVANFLGYVERGDYNQTYIHRTANTSTGDFKIVQGGGYRFTPFVGSIDVPEQDPVPNEPGFSNVRGTIAMAKFSGQPDSATSEWFFNITDNSASLDNQNGGFTAFGEVLGGEAGMTTLDAIMNLQKVDLGSRANFAPIVSGVYEGRPDEEFVFVNMEVVSRFSSAVNVYEATRALLIASVNVDGGAEAYSLNFSVVDEDTIEVNVDSVLKLVSAPEAAATFDSSNGRLFFPAIEFSAGPTAFICTNAEFALESTDPFRFTLVSFDPC